MLLGSGSIRNPELGPIVLLSDLVECFPYDDAIHMVKLSGAQLKRMIGYMLRDEVWAGAHCEFYQFSDGFRVVYDRGTHAFSEFSLNGEPMEDDALYTVGLQDFTYNNTEIARIVATSCRDVLDEYLSEHQNLTKELDGRLTVL